MAVAAAGVRFAGPSETPLVALMTDPESAKDRKGRITPEKAALKMAVMCPCGIFNQHRAAELLKRETEAD